MANTMKVLDWEVHENLSTHHDIFDKIRDFAVAQGWTKSREEQDKVWASIGGGNYGFVSGSEDFMELKSTGYGSQNIIIRFRLADSGTGNADYLYFHGHLYDTLNTTSSTHPVSRNGTTTNWDTGTGAGQRSLRRSSIPALWLFGYENRWICFVVKLDVSTICVGCFGSFNLYDTSATQHLWISNDNYAFQSWELKTMTQPFDFTLNGDGVYFDSANQYNTSKFLVNFTCAPANTIAETAYYPYAYGLCKNSYTFVRPIFEQLCYAKNSSNIWYPFGTPFVGRINTHGLEIGEHLKYGSEEYIVFPNRDVNAYLGIAFRIA